MKLETQKEAWKKWGDYEFYKIFTCPGRPSRDDIRNYNRFVARALKDKKAPEILILGCTPELRDMMAKYSAICEAKITCVDMARSMWETMSRYTEINNKKNENFINDSWIDVKLNKKFDVILGDYVINNIDQDKKERFFQNIALHLKKEGRFITRDFVIDEKHKLKPLRWWFESYVKPLLEEKMTRKEAVNWIENELLYQSWFTNENSHVSLNFISKEIENLKKELKSNSDTHPMLRYFFDAFYSNYEMIRDKYWTPLEEKEEKKLLQKFFKLEKTLNSADYSPLMTKASPIFCLTKK